MISSIELVSGRGLADNGEIEAPGDAAELIAGAGKAGGQRQRLGGNARAPGLPREKRSMAAFAALSLSACWVSMISAGM